MLIAEFHLSFMQVDKWVPNKSHAAGKRQSPKMVVNVCGPIMATSTYHPLLNALLRATRLAYYPYVTYPVHFTAVTIARSVPTADLLLSQVKLGFYRERQS
jgi:hypothetical protein